MTEAKGRTERGNRLAIVDIVKALSCVMIFLYHCNTILPGEWKFLTLFGQDLGNNLFFMVSGFALAPSIDATPLNKAHRWYLRRLVRILPITAIAYIAAYIRGYYSFSDPMLVFTVFVYPTLYWFITAILVFYIILFVFAKFSSAKPLRSRAARIVLLSLAILYLLLAKRQERLYVIGFFAMLSGYLLREMMLNGHPLTEDTKANRIKMLVLLLSCFALFMAGELTDRAYISKALIFAGAIGTGMSMLMLGYYLDGRLVSNSFIRYIGDMALPLYLVQCFCSGYIGYWIGLHVDFPLSFLVNFITVWTAGSVLYCIEKCTGKCYNKMLQKSEREN